ncbi:MAG: hypothetical protein FD189_2112 [Elusimicrobia bacterium]|nr:MAG: hypothetical protein FD154_2012 [Elusimicrobiota bacterium]KAF0154106.1 MAG: hypothetical protein FD189_2112 [Elusimicrobiota bacterium]
MPCANNVIQNHKVGYYYSILVSSSVPTLINPPFLLSGTSYYLIYNFNSNQYTTIKRFESASKSSSSAEDMMSEEGMLNHAISAAGYGARAEANDGTITANEALVNPMYLNQYLAQRYSIPMSTVPHHPGGVIYLNVDFFPTCINQIPSASFRRTAYYALSSSRVLWNSVRITNPSRHPIQDVTVYIERPWQGISELLEPVVVAEGGIVVHSSPFYYVVRFPMLLSNASKVMFLKTHGRPLIHSEVSIESVPVRSPSILLLCILTITAFILSVLYAFPAIWKGITTAYTACCGAMAVSMRKMYGWITKSKHHLLRRKQKKD